jgi:hypothetical protein
MVSRWAKQRTQARHVSAYLSLLGLIATLAIFAAQGPAAAGFLLRTLVPAPSESGRAGAFDPASGKLFPASG